MNRSFRVKHVWLVVIFVSVSVLLLTHDKGVSLVQAQEDVKKQVEAPEDSAELSDESAPGEKSVGDRRIEPADKKDESNNGESSDPGEKEAEENRPDLGPIMDSLEEIRELTFKKKVPTEFQAKEDFRKMVKESLESEFPEDKQKGMQRALRRLGMLEKEVDLVDEMSNALKSQAAAYYDPKADKFFYLSKRMNKTLLDATASHELVHALQDQYFDLGMLMKKLEEAEGPRNDDQILAARCVFEGEATYVQSIWQIIGMMGGTVQSVSPMVDMSLGMMANQELDQLQDLLTKGMKQMGLDADEDMRQAMESMDDIPRYILEPLMSAYMKGALFISKVRKADGWDSVNRLYDHLPLTAEQCLHASKYSKKKRDNPTPLTLPDFSWLEEAGWREMDSAIHGEFYLGLLLKVQGCQATKANKAARGWDGDVYKAWGMGKDHVLITLATTWDRAKDAQQFFDAYRGILPNKYPEMKTDEMDAVESGKPEQGGEEKNEQEETFSYFCGKDSLGHGVLLLRGLEVFAVEGGDTETCQKILADLKQLDIEHVK